MPTELPFSKDLSADSRLNEIATILAIGVRRLMERSARTEPFSDPTTPDFTPQRTSAIPLESCPSGLANTPETSVTVHTG